MPQCILYLQFGALNLHNHDDKYPAQPQFEPGTSRLQAPVDTNDPSGPAYIDIDIHRYGNIYFDFS